MLTKTSGDAQSQQAITGTGSDCLPCGLSHNFVQDEQVMLDTLKCAGSHQVLHAQACPGLVPHVIIILKTPGNGIVSCSDDIQVISQQQSKQHARRRSKRLQAGNRCQDGLCRLDVFFFSI